MRTLSEIIINNRIPTHRHVHFDVETPQYDDGFLCPAQAAAFAGDVKRLFPESSLERDGDDFTVTSRNGVLVVRPDGVDGFLSNSVDLESVFRDAVYFRAGPAADLGPVFPLSDPTVFDVFEKNYYEVMEVVLSLMDEKNIPPEAIFSYCRENLVKRDLATLTSGVDGLVYRLVKQAEAAAEVSGFVSRTHGEYGLELGLSDAGREKLEEFRVNEILADDFRRESLAFDEMVS